jgi:chromosome segregation ATPase
MATERGADQTVIRRTIIERGIRSSTDNPAGGRAGLEAVRKLANQHEGERLEMQELNTKFGAYLDRVKFLETQNRKLQAQLDELKQKWGKIHQAKEQLIINIFF